MGSRKKGDRTVAKRSSPRVSSKPRRKAPAKDSARKAAANPATDSAPAGDIVIDPIAAPDAPDAADALGAADAADALDVLGASAALEGRPAAFDRIAPIDETIRDIFAPEESISDIAQPLSDEPIPPFDLPEPEPINFTAGNAGGEEGADDDAPGASAPRTAGANARAGGIFAGMEGFVAQDAPLARYTWYKIGGPAQYLIQPRSLEELQLAARRCSENEIPVHVLGLGANLLVADEGVAGAVFRLSSEFFRHVRIDGARLDAAAGVDMQKLLLRCVRQGLTGLECLAGIPGTVGGGIRMNAGGKFGDIGAFVRSVTVMDSAGGVYECSRDELVFDYRSTNIAAPFILGAAFDLDQDDPQRITKKVKEIWMYKRNSQPLNTKNAGCIFKNPRGLSAGALIDQAGLKGARVGGAEVSEKHANFIIAHPGATAADILQLIETIRARVLERNEIHLESEVRVWS